MLIPQERLRHEDHVRNRILGRAERREKGDEEEGNSKQPPRSSKVGMSIMVPSSMKNKTTDKDKGDSRSNSVPPLPPPPPPPLPPPPPTVQKPLLHNSNSIPRKLKQVDFAALW